MAGWIVPSLAQEPPLPTSITMVAPGDGVAFDWPVITADHRGLYSKVYDAIFGAAGIQVVQKSYPNLRCKALVAQGKADFYPGDIAGEVFEGYSYLTPRYAIWYTQGETLVFRKATIPKWEGVRSLKGLRLLGLETHLAALEKYRDQLGPELDAAATSQTSEGALSLLLKGRVDVLVASVELVKTAEARLQVKLSPDEYQLQALDRNKYYPQFQNNDRGRQLARIFDQGLAKLARSGQLKAWFQEPGNFSSVDNIDPDLPRP